MTPLNEDAWEKQFAATGQDGTEGGPFTELPDVAPQFIWSCSDGANDTQIIESGIVPGAHSWWISATAVPRGEHFCVTRNRED
jgi:hypothetical protein